MPVNGDAPRRDMWAGRIGRCLAADRQGMISAQQDGTVQPAQMDCPLPQGGSRALSPQVERSVELDEGRPPRHQRNPLSLEIKLSKSVLLH